MTRHMEPSAATKLSGQMSRSIAHCHQNQIPKRVSSVTKSSSCFRNTGSCLFLHLDRHMGQNHRSPKNQKSIRI